MPLASRLTMATLEENAFWAQAQAGDEDARSAVARLTIEVSRLELAARGAPRDEIDALAQQAAVSVLAFLQRGGEVTRNLRAFLKCRARGVLSDFRKRSRSRHEAVPIDEDFDPRSSIETPEARARRVELGEAVTDCQERLRNYKPELAEAIKLRYDDDLSNTEIAELVGASPNAINIRVFRALQNLRECLNGKGVREDFLG